MLRAALALLSTLQIGARIKESFKRSLRQAAVIAVAAVLLVAAAVFGLIAAYHALVSIYQFDAAEAAAIMAGVLMLVGLIVIAVALSMGRGPKRPAQASPFVSAPDPTACSIRASARPCSRSATCHSSPSPSRRQRELIKGARQRPYISLSAGARKRARRRLSSIGASLTTLTRPRRRAGPWLSPLRKHEVLPSVQPA